MRKKDFIFSTGQTARIKRPKPDAAPTGKQWLNAIHKPSPTILAKNKQTTTITTKPGRKSLSKCFSQGKMLCPWKWVARQAYSTAPSPIRVKP